MNSARGNNVSCLRALAEIYCYIRDLQKSHWCFLQLLEMRMVNKSHNSSPGVCGHCGTFIYPGGQKKCPINHLKALVAQERMSKFSKSNLGGNKIPKSLFHSVGYIFCIYCICVPDWRWSRIKYTRTIL